MDLQLTKDGLRCVISRAGQPYVRRGLEVVVVGLSVHSLDIKDMVYYII